MEYVGEGLTFDDILLLPGRSEILPREANLNTYLTKTIKRLKNVLENDAKFADYIEEEFGQYEWFKKDGKFLNY